MVSRSQRWRISVQRSLCDSSPRCSVCCPKYLQHRSPRKKLFPLSWHITFFYFNDLTIAQSLSLCKQQVHVWWSMFLTLLAGDKTWLVQTSTQRNSLWKQMEGKQKVPPVYYFINNNSTIVSWHFSHVDEAERFKCETTWVTAIFLSNTDWSAETLSQKRWEVFQVKLEEGEWKARGA